MKQFIRTFLVLSLLCSLAVSAFAASPFLEVARGTGMEVLEEDGITIWRGEYNGQAKPNGPLVGKKIGLIVGCEFSDWQAYYFANFIGFTSF